MPRRKRTNKITVEPWPDLKSRFYQGKILSACSVKASRGICIRIENLDPSQRDRIHEIDMPWPRPGNRTSEFLVACGVGDVEVGTRVDLQQLVGRVIEFRPHRQIEGEPERFDFRHIATTSVSETMVSETDQNVRDNGAERSETVDRSFGGPQSSFADMG